MLEPINARLASSCSMNGIIDVATEIIWIGQTPTKSIFEESHIMNSDLYLAGTTFSTNVLSFVNLTSAGAQR